MLSHHSSKVLVYIATTHLPIGVSNMTPSIPYNSKGQQLLYICAFYAYQTCHSNISFVQSSITRLRRHCRPPIYQPMIHKMNPTKKTYSLNRRTCFTRLNTHIKHPSTHNSHSLNQFKLKTSRPYAQINQAVSLTSFLKYTHFHVKG